MTEAHALLLLHLMPIVGYTTKTALYALAGSEARRVLACDFDEPPTPIALRNLQRALKQVSEVEEQITKIHAFNDKNNVQTLTIADAEYPQRLREGYEPPFALFVRGNGYNLNAKHIVSVVGTRQISPYGQDLCRHTMKALETLKNDVLIVSGLAYGVDICAHREAIKQRLPNIAVLAHGLDRIYPTLHTTTANEIAAHGALLTEYPPNTIPDKGRFVRRNRIVAGLCDACLVVESAERGGALITAQLAFDTNRELLAYPGRTLDSTSQGCNKLIAQGKAQLLLSADELLTHMGWDIDKQAKKDASTAQTTLFDEQLPPTEQAILCVLAHNSEGLSLNQLVSNTGLSIATITAAVINLEIMGRVVAIAGNVYRLLH